MKNNISTMEPILNYEISELLKVCRVCLNKETIVNILDTQYKNISMKQIFLTIFHDKINEDDTGPVSLCSKCLESILNSYDLLMKYENSQTILEQWQREMVSLKDSSDAVDEIEIKEKPLVDSEMNVVADKESVVESATPSSPAADDTNSYICVLCDYNGKVTSLTEPISALQRHYLRQHLLEIEMEMLIFFCLKCNENFATLPEILQHTSSTKHQNKQCPTCGKQLKTIKQYYRHVKNDKCKAKDKPYSCRSCHVDLATFNDVLQHFKMNNHRFDKTCMLCNKPNQVMSIHIMTHRPKEMPYACVICLLPFADEEDYKAHNLQTDHKKKQCWLCGKFITRCNFTFHLQRHIQKKQFTCEVCGKIFTETSNLKRHYNISHEGMRFYCDQCPVSYTVKMALTKHIAEFHNQKSDGVRKERKVNPLKKRLATTVCEICGKKLIKYNIRQNTLHDANHKFGHNVICKVGECLRTFLDANELQSHMENEHGRFFCEYCQRNYYDKRQFETHINLHNWKNNYSYEKLPLDQQIVCRICDTKFPHCQQLAAHLKQNYGLLMCTRDDCFKAFANKITLKQHMCDHNGKPTLATASSSAKERPFSCNVCLKRFCTSQHLIRHSRVHSEERPFECRHCDKKFKYGTSRKLHERIHTGEKPFSCNKCDRRFSDGAYASRHRNKCKSNQNVGEKATETA